jgi:creatinine amidohydrolase
VAAAGLCGNIGDMNVAREVSLVFRRLRLIWFCLLVGCLVPLNVSAAEQSAPNTREMERINWMEFREWVPGKINTVLLPLGTIEPHGVTANGADIIAPVAIAREIAPRLNAMIAPVIPEEIYRAYVRAVLLGLAKNKFKNIILLNGHGGGQTAILTALVQDMGRETGTRMLVVNWWSYCSDVTVEVFGEDGGHAAENENAFIMAIDPSLVHPERYNKEMVTANPSPGTWSAYPNPSSITLYKEGQGYLKFDLAKAKSYFSKVNEKLTRLIQETIRKWDLAGL